MISTMLRKIWFWAEAASTRQYEDGPIASRLRRLRGRRLLRVAVAAISGLVLGSMLGLLGISPVPFDPATTYPMLESVGLSALAGAGAMIVTFEFAVAYLGHLKFQEERWNRRHPRGGPDEP